MPSQSPQPAVRAGGGEARVEGNQLALVAPCAGSLLYAAGASLGTVQTLLGHWSSEVAREHYIHDVASESRSAMDQMRNLLVRPKLTQMQNLAKESSSLVH
jgi:hypothetical protein